MALIRSVPAAVQFKELAYIIWRFVYNIFFGHDEF
jgi:hypothetical protein